MIISEIIEGLIEFIQTTIFSPVAEALQSLYSSISDFALSVSPHQNVLDFSGACIKLFVPYRQIGVAVTILLPVIIINLVVAVVLRVKSFVPTMGGK